MIQSQTLNDLMTEKVAYGIADLKSDAKGIYRYGKQSTGLLRDLVTESIGDASNTFLPNNGNKKLTKLKNYLPRDYSPEEMAFKHRREIANMDSIVRQHGYQRVETQADKLWGGATWENPTTGKSFRLDPSTKRFDATSMAGPHMEPGVGSDTIRVGKRGGLRSKGVMMHEFGHHLQGPKMRKLDDLARMTGRATPVLAAVNTAVGPFTYGLPATIAINKGLAATAAAAGATVAGSEMQASYLGSKHLGKRIGHRSRAFVGVPSYIADTLVSPRTPLKQNSGLLKKLVKLK